ncbi:MAG: exodeoxyribonuclease VII small subunit [Bdellovibrionales bacterium RIFOXYD12_FULL_39_22]|nr:MAG: exodeoxyribonuclease VII small subunit [Bdellovibrionales bacterium RIFOXYB1_FULL_39_21]OFZ42077.1 MAG: exodeoxyribonuclease VII small subunit [Bdellovibrionales bacterium RIFOXYC12_FULL_39_17]OFZ50793.1 MAG: exodeoxyribonuclease VII small subunit [Bdellovibrionales bacterium RIFOXYC1_FULL_39_130]OFZ73457.1 MAG: exodeoxyribonuclease VII small subunit [Bdellovibrionales bacterium RIFOXYC2_FULL_39_8]OFZ78016.1 MAG: exodeoxyribonuclease VII small subunit [Bdellovibrionales bacterium RIFOXY
MSKRVNEKENSDSSLHLADFEKYLDKLEKLVGALESGELSLDDGLKNFEEGVALYKNCKSLLGSAEKKISVLTSELKEEDFI